MRISPVSSFLLTVVFWACTPGSADEPRSAQESDRASKAAGKTSSRSEQSEAKCSLSPTEQVEAVKRFKALMPVFHHPRCANCHGGIDFFSPSHEDTHGGGLVAMNEGAVIGPDGTIITRKSPDFATCVACHDAAGPMGWVIPGPLRDVSFAGRSAGQICEQIKHLTRLGPKVFMDHIETDHLIGLAFEGRRGHTSLDPLPPPMAQAAFNAKVGAWLESLKAQDKWPEPLSCGCVAPTAWRGTVTYQQVLDVTGEDGDYSWVPDEGVLYWTDGVPGKMKAEAEFTFEGPEGHWRAKGEYGAISPCTKLTSSISGSGTSKLSVSDARTGKNWDPLPSDSLPSVTVDIDSDGSYTVDIKTGELVGKSFYTTIASHQGESRCGESGEADERTSLSYRAQGRVDPGNPNVLSGSKDFTGDGGGFKVTWNLLHDPAAKDK